MSISIGHWTLHTKLGVAIRRW